MEPKWLQNGSLEASGRPLGGHPATTSILNSYTAPFWLRFEVPKNDPNDFLILQAFVCFACVGGLMVLASS